jgi:integrase
MAHVQRRCRSCAKTMPPRTTVCSYCGSRDSTWRARYRAPDGHEKSKTFERKTDAERWLNDTQTAKAHGQWIDPALGRTKFEVWAERWMATREPVLKPKTTFGYRSLLRSRIYPTFGAWRLEAIAPSDVQTWTGAMRSEGLSPARIRQAHVVVSMILRAAVREGLIVRNAAADADLPRTIRREAAYLEPKDVERIAKAMPEPYDLLVRTLGTLGLRFGEAAALRRRSIDLLGRRLILEESVAELGAELVFGPTKTHAVRRVPLTASLLAAFDAHLEAHVAKKPDALVFTSPEGGPLRHSNFYHRCWQPALKRIELPRVGIHVLRHSAAAGMISSGASPKAVQTILGYASAAFTLTVYGHMFEADLDEVARRLDELAAPLPGAGPAA